MTQNSPREDALTLWQAGVDAVDSSRLVQQVVSSSEDNVTICGTRWNFGLQGRICVVGAGKAGAGMAAGFESQIDEKWRSRISGWVNVPEDCVSTLNSIHLHGARPAGVNEPTLAGVVGTQEILQRVQELTEHDLCVVLLSGGGSALLPAPVTGVTLAEKQQVTRALMHSGATIQELNTVRRAISLVKGGGLLRACRGGRLIALIISDVIGDPLETIASGPTVDLATSPTNALQILQEMQQQRGADIPLGVLKCLQDQLQTSALSPVRVVPHSNHVIGNNRTAVNAAARRAESLGYRVLLEETDQDGIARECGSGFAQKLIDAHAQNFAQEKLCLISGGESIVHLTTTLAQRKGGRNQEFVLAAAQVLQHKCPPGLVVLSGGTDGEDGPTDAAGAVIDLDLLQRAEQMNLNLEQYLSINNSYPFFEKIGGLIKTGPTHTNVMDLRIGVIQ